MFFRQIVMDSLPDAMAAVIEETVHKHSASVITNKLIITPCDDFEGESKMDFSDETVQGSFSANKSHISVNNMMIVNPQQYYGLTLITSALVEFQGIPVYVKFVYYMTGVTTYGGKLTINNVRDVFNTTKIIILHMAKSVAYSNGTHCGVMVYSPSDRGFTMMHRTKFYRELTKNGGFTIMANQVPPIMYAEIKSIGSTKFTFVSENYVTEDEMIKGNTIYGTSSISPKELLSLDNLNIEFENITGAISVTPAYRLAKQALNMDSDAARSTCEFETTVSYHQNMMNLITDIAGASCEYVFTDFEICTFINNATSTNDTRFTSLVSPISGVSDAYVNAFKSSIQRLINNEIRCLKLMEPSIYQTLMKTGQIPDVVEGIELYIRATESTIIVKIIVYRNVSVYPHLNRRSEYKESMNVVEAFNRWCPNHINSVEDYSSNSKLVIETQNIY